MHLDISTVLYNAIILKPILLFINSQKIHSATYFKAWIKV